MVSQEAAVPNPQVEAQAKVVADQDYDQQAMEAWKKQYKEYMTQHINQKVLSVQVELSRERSSLMSAREEIDCLKAQLGSYKESTEIAVSEKSDLTKEMARFTELLKAKEVEVENASKKAADMEKTLLGIQTHQAEPDPTLVAEISRLEHEVKDCRILLHKKANEVSELQSRLVFKDKENEVLSKELSDKSAQLEGAERSLLQIRSFALTTLEKRLREKDEMILKLEQEKADMKKQEEGLTAYIRQMGQDREHIILQYTAYSQQLMAQIACLTEQLNARPVRNFEPFFSKEESEMLDANNKCHSLGKDEGSNKSMGWKKIARFFIAQDSRPELELQDLASRGHGSVHVDFRQVGFEPRKVRRKRSARVALINFIPRLTISFQAFLVNVGLGASVTKGVTLSNAVNHVLDAVLTDCEDETTGCFYVASSKLRR